MIGIVFLILSVLLGVGTAIYLKLDTIKNKKKNTADTLTNNKNVKKTSNDKKQGAGLLNMLEIEEIKNNLIKLKGNRYRAILSISSPDIELLTDAEQESVENAFMEFSLSLSSNTSVQFYTTTQRIETKEPAKNIENLIQKDDDTISQALKEYASKLLNKEIEIENQRGTYVRKSYCIIGVDDIPDEKRALNQLKNAMDTVVTGLSRARMKIALLDTYKIAQLLASVLNKESNINIQQLVKDGAFELYTDGLGVNVDEERIEGKEAKAS